MAGDLSSADTLVSPSGERIDMRAFAREMFREGYRQGYVSGLTEMQTATARQMSDRASSDDVRRMMRGQEAANASGTPTMQRQDDGSTLILLPAGMSPQAFIRSLDQ
jgi:hypothetical protein